MAVPYNASMAEREPALLGDRPGPGAAPAAGDGSVTTDARAKDRPGDVGPPGPPNPPRKKERNGAGSVRPDGAARVGRDSPTVHVAGFWRRLAAGFVDLAVILPVSLVFTWIASNIAGVHLPASRIRGIDFWLDLLLSSDPALMTAFAMIIVVACIYLMTFQVVMGQTLGMRLLRMRVIDVWGERPSIARCAARTGGYLLGAATVMLGFLWVGFDSEKRGLHDWIAGTYVIKA